MFVYADGVSMAIGFEPDVRSHQRGPWTIDRCGRSVVSNRSRRYEQYGEGGVDEGDVLSDFGTGTDVGTGVESRDLHQRHAERSNH